MTELVKRRLIFLALAAVGGFVIGSVGWGMFMSSVLDAAGGTGDFGPSPKAGMALAGLAVLSILVDWINET